MVPAEGDARAGEEPPTAAGTGAPAAGVEAGADDPPPSASQQRQVARGTPPAEEAPPSSEAPSQGDGRPSTFSALPFAPVERRGTSREAFERRLTREILISERLRVQILAAIPGLALILFMAATASNAELVDRALSGKMDRLRVGLLLGAFTAYELVALWYVEKLITTGREPPVLRRYLNALVEVSLPSCVILYYMAFTDTDPVAALLLPAPFFYFVFILLSTLRLDFLLCFFTGLVAALQYLAISLVVIAWGRWSVEHTVFASAPHHIAKASVLLASGIAAGFVARRLRRAFINTLRSLEERREILDLFGQHVSPEVVDQLVARREEARSQVREVCVMFLDVRGFTAFSEKRTPEEVVGYLNALFEVAVEKVNARHGIVNKFLGDGFMAVFGAPLSDGQDCKHAVEAALEILARVEELVAAGRLPATRLGIALHAGEAVVGNVGSTMRKEYTVIGDVVNVASRVEALNKELGSQLLITDRVWELSGKEVAGATAQPPLHVRGREEPVRIWRLA
jgi:adenylate cyclase